MVLNLPPNSTESTEVGVMQIPRHEVTEVGQAVTLKCKPISNHDSLFWYKQTSKQGPELLTYFRKQDQIGRSGMPKNRFSAEMPNKLLSILKIQPTEPGDSAIYFCASSVDTALQNHLALYRNPPAPASSDFCSLLNSTAGNPP